MARCRREALISATFFVVCYWRDWSNAAATADKDLRPLTQAELSKLLADLLALNPDATDCPAPRVPVARSRCRAQPCSSDDDCRWNSHRCCFNGCVFTCLPKLPPPPVIDWTKEVRPGNGTRTPKHFTGEAVLALLCQHLKQGWVHTYTRSKIKSAPVYPNSAANGKAKWTV